MGWAVEAVADYVDNIRPRFGAVDHPALWVTERGGALGGANGRMTVKGQLTTYKVPGIDDPSVECSRGDHGG